MELIVLAGNGERVQLSGCKHDKSGGRLLCDMMTSHRESAASAMIASGLAVPHDKSDKRKSWCGGSDELATIQQNVAGCLL